MRVVIRAPPWYALKSAARTLSHEGLPGREPKRKGKLSAPPLYWLDVPWSGRRKTFTRTFSDFLHHHHGMLLFVIGETVSPCNHRWNLYCCCCRCSIIYTINLDESNTLTEMLMAHRSNRLMKSLWTWKSILAWPRATSLELISHQEVFIFYI